MRCQLDGSLPWPGLRSGQRLAGSRSYSHPACLYVDSVNSLLVSSNRDDEADGCRVVSDGLMTGQQGPIIKPSRRYQNGISPGLLG